MILKGDLNIKADVSYRDNITVLRNLEYDNNQVTAGQRLVAIKVTADYALTKNLTALFFYDHNFSEFAISTAFPQTSKIIRMVITTSSILMLIGVGSNGFFLLVLPRQTYHFFRRWKIEDGLKGHWNNLFLN